MTDIAAPASPAPVVVPEPLLRIGGRAVPARSGVQFSSINPAKLSAGIVTPSAPMETGEEFGLTEVLS